ncbi:branched-chain amino acid ABC transporter permease, partial [Pseudomonas syringae pv. actinidiae ICMP 18804]
MQWLSEFGAIAAMQGFNGLSVFCVLLLMALGLAIIFGQMGVINMAHGEFLTVGAYTTYVLSTLVQTYMPSMQPYYFFFAIALSFVVAGSIGWVVERVMISRLYHRPLDTLLATWGLSLVMQQALRSIFGA